MLYNARSFSYKYTGAFLQVIGTMGRVPYLSAFHDIGNIIMLAPNILEFVFQRTIVFSNQGVSNTQLAMIDGIGNDLVIKINQGSRLEGKFNTL